MAAADGALGAHRTFDPGGKELASLLFVWRRHGVDGDDAGLLAAAAAADLLVPMLAPTIRSHTNSSLEVVS